MQDYLASSRSGGCSFRRHLEGTVASAEKVPNIGSGRPRQMTGATGRASRSGTWLRERVVCGYSQNNKLGRTQRENWKQGEADDEAGKRGQVAGAEH